MRLLVRDLEIDIVITPSENSSLFNVGLQINYWRYTRNVNFLFYRKFNKLYFLSEQFFRISFVTEI